MLTDKQAYMAMFSFLEDYYFRIKAEEVGDLLSSIQLLKTGRPFDPAVIEDWRKAVEKALTTDIPGNGELL